MPSSLAAVVVGFGQPLELQSVPFPSLDLGGVLVKVDAATLCGTDVHFWHGQIIAPESVPYIPGHETCGTIVEMNGPRTDLLGVPLKIGDRIIAAYPFCGHCFYCTVARQPVLCRNVIAYGRIRADKPPYLLGGCAEYHYFPPGCDIVRVPENVTPPLAASAACALRTIMHAFEKLGRVASSETVLVQGAGPVGLYATAVARDKGAKQVLVIGAPAGRLAVARAFGADDVLDIDEITDQADRLDWVRQRTDGRGPDVVLQCAVSAAIPEGLEMIRPGGRYVTIGASAGSIALTGGLFTVKYVDVIGILMAEGRHFLQAVEFLSTRHDVPFARMITGTYGLERVTDALQAMADFREVKPVIVPTPA